MLLPALWGALALQKGRAGDRQHSTGAEALLWEKGGAGLVSGFLGVLVKAKGVQTWINIRKQFLTPQLCREGGRGLGGCNAPGSTCKQKLDGQGRGPGSRLQDHGWALPQGETLLTKLVFSRSRSPLARSTTTVRRFRRSL